MELKALSDQKIKRREDLKVRPAFSFYSRSKNLLAHLEKIQKALISVLPEPLPFSDRESLRKWLKESLPYMVWSPFEAPPDCVSISFLIKPLGMLPSEVFISEMIKRWLLPHQETTILSFEHMLVQFEHYPKEVFFFGEAKVLIHNKKEAGLLKINLPLLKREIITAISAGRYAKSMLETTSLPLDHKMNLIRESFVKLLHRFPDDLDEVMFERLAYMQAYATKEFRQERSYVHLGRLILTFLITRNQLGRAMNSFPEKRHMRIRFLPTELTFHFGKKAVLGLSIGVNLFHKYEVFDEKHVLRAVQKFLPDARIVPGSIYRPTILNDPILSFYLEIERQDGSPIPLQVRKELKKELEEELVKRIEHLVPSIFMVRNEEETMRNILLLSGEIKSKDDIPQMMISFDQHSQDDLIFTVVFLRVKKEGDPSIQDLLKVTDSRIRFIPDRVQTVSFIEKTMPVEANVFRLQMEKLPSFLRMDFSVNLYLAREEVVKFLKTHLGELRDYNGGMMVKQGELLTQFKRLFHDVSKRNQELLENFFYSLNPIEAQATIALSSLSLFFEIFIRLVEKAFPRDRSYLLEEGEDKNITILVVRGNHQGFRGKLEEVLSDETIQGRSLVSSSLNIEGSYYLGFLYTNPSKDKHETFKSKIKETLEEWEEDRKKLQILKIPYSNFPSLDPRVGGDQASSVMVKLLFNGLTRINKEGTPEFAVAESYTLSDDKKTYIFTLKETYWSNGSPVIAYDFEYAWKKVLSPGFNTTFAYVFYPIKNGKAAKEGKVSLDDVGVKALDPRTLKVELENPAPYFLELTANTIYSPINSEIDQKHPNWTNQKNEHFVCNGPYQQVEPSQGYIYNFVKNPGYVKAEEVAIDQILCIKTQQKPAFEMFRQKELHCMGSYIYPLVHVQFGFLKENISHYIASKVYWQCINVNHFPFNHKKIRIALSKAISRQELTMDHSIKRVPAYTPLPCQLTLCQDSDFLIREDEDEAKRLFQEALEEINLKLEDFPIVYIACIPPEKENASLMKARWERVLGIKCELEVNYWDRHFQKMTAKDYHIGGIYWASWFNDPIYTLDSFKEFRERVNFTGWENLEYKKLLAVSNQAIDPDKRKNFLYQAEKMIIEEAILIPIYYCVDAIIKQSDLILSPPTSNGTLDLSQARFLRDNDHAHNHA